MLVKKPKREDFSDRDGVSGQYWFILAERDYWMNRAEFAIAALDTVYNTALKHHVYVNDERALLNIEEHCNQVISALKDNE